MKISLAVKKIFPIRRHFLVALLEIHGTQLQYRTIQENVFPSAIHYSTVDLPGCYFILLYCVSSLVTRNIVIPQ
jgi:hypothetical protein